MRSCPRTPVREDEQPRWVVSGAKRSGVVGQAGSCLVGEECSWIAPRSSITTTQGASKIAPSALMEWGGSSGRAMAARAQCVGQPHGVVGDDGVGHGRAEVHLYLRQRLSESGIPPLSATGLLDHERELEHAKDAHDGSSATGATMTFGFSHRRMAEMRASAASPPSAAITTSAASNGPELWANVPHSDATGRAGPC